MSTKQLSARVSSGFGLAASNFARAFDVICQRTGLTLVPGTLNVVLGREYALTPDGVVSVTEIGGYEDLQYARCRVIDRASEREVDAVIVRTSTQAEGRSKHGRSVLEIAAPTHLRSELELRDGSRVWIEVDRKEVLRPC
jgi:CTP-dependent riboflavin kinase